MVVLAGFLAIFIGVAVGLLGGGGSILTTPLLVYVLHFDPKQAIAASLLVVASAGSRIGAPLSSVCILAHADHVTAKVLGGIGDGVGLALYPAAGACERI